MFQVIKRFFDTYQDKFTTTEHVFVEGCMNTLLIARLSDEQLNRLQEIVKKYEQ